MSFIPGYTYLMEELSDPRVRDWPLMSGAATPLTIISIYLYTVLKGGPRYMENRKPFNIKKIIQVYNVFQVISCLWLICGVLNNGWLTRYSVFKCHPVDYSDDPMTVRLAEYVWWTMSLKLLELIETVFFVMRKKYNQVSKLHLYHHVSTFLIAWLGVKFIAGGMATFSIIINSFIHVLMYTYYFLSTLGPEWQKSLDSWKPKLTLLQMTQFCILIAHSTIALREDCPVPKILAYIYIPNVIIVFYLFYKFYNQSYIQGMKQNSQNKCK